MPISPTEQRLHPRLELYASVELSQAGESLILPAQNVSLGGVMLAADGHDLSSFRVDSALDVLIFDAADENRPPVRALARVVRHQPGGMALAWERTQETTDQLSALLSSMKPKP